MNGLSGAMSPISVDGSDWSGINQYQKSEPPFSPTFSNRGNLATPPTSGTPSASLGMNGNAPAVGPTSNGGGANGNGLLNGASGQMSDSGNPSPPSSVAGARSSDGTTDHRSRRYKQMEEVLGQHYTALRRFLHAPYRDERSAKANKARDKLLRLSPTQFHELSTDVYDELLRRQQAMPSPGRSPRADVPPHLLPRDDFHEKRNQARQKLASLQHQRFRDLATDVFCELERRFPQFAEKESRRASPAASFRGRPSNGYGYRPPPGAQRSQSRGPHMGRGYPSGGPGSPMAPGGFPPRQGSLGGPPSGVNGEPAPLPKAFQSNTIVPNKSIMVEDDDDDAAATEDDFDARSDAFGLEAILSRRNTSTTLGDGERKLLAESQTQVSTLQEKVDKLEELVRSKDEELSKSNRGSQEQTTNSEREEWETLKLDLESKISKAVDLNSSLQIELKKVREEQEGVERDLRGQLEASRQGEGDSDLQARFADLEIKHQTLQTELEGQQRVTEEVRREASTFLKEMRELSEQSHSNWGREEHLSSEVHRLDEEVKQWKSRYAKAKTQLRHLRASSMGIADARPDVSTLVAAKDHELMQENGLIKDVHVTKFQIAIDELLRIARYDEHRLVMPQIQAVVIAVRYILQDAQPASTEWDDVAAAQKAIRKVSATANNLITASKNFAHSSGLSPVSLLDAAASHLSTAVVEIVHLVKIRASPQDELEDVDVAVEEDINMGQLKSPDYFSVAPSQSRHSHNDNESMYSAIHPPSEYYREQSMSDHSALANGVRTSASTGVGVGVGAGAAAAAATGVGAAGMSNGDVSGWPEPRFNYAVTNEHELQEVKLYVENQTEGLVQTIQALVSSIRAEEDLSMIRTHTTAISTVVNNVSSSTKGLIHKPDVNPALNERCGPTIQTLEANSSRLSDTVQAGESVTGGELREITNKLPPIAFEIARETKDLVQQLNPEDDEEDDFR